MDGLLGPTARPMVALGGANAWKQRHIKGIFCSYQWLDLRAQGFEDTPDHAAVACMCLFRPGSMSRGTFVVPQPMAFMYGDKRGNPTAHCLSRGFLAAEQLGFDMRDRHAIRDILTIIIEGLPDLVLMPSEPPYASDVIVKQAVLGIEATAKIAGKTVHAELL